MTAFPQKSYVEGRKKLTSDFRCILEWRRSLFESGHHFSSVQTVREWSTEPGDRIQVFISVRFKLIFTVCTTQIKFVAEKTRNRPFKLNLLFEINKTNNSQALKAYKECGDAISCLMAFLSILLRQILSSHWIGWGSSCSYSMIIKNVVTTLKNC